MSKRPTVLAVDDEEKMLGILRQYLTQEQFEVLTAQDGEEALGLFRERSEIDLVLLDWMMPGMNGPEVCRRLREMSEVPVIFLTAKSDEFDKLLGLELGADDYITKPFSMRELAARIRVVLRRLQKGQSQRQSASSARDVEAAQQLVRGALVVDLARHEVTVEGREVVVTPTEFKLLATLAAAPGRVYSRLQLLESALGEEYAGYERSIDTHISNLRKKIEADPARPQWIVTVFGVGYKFAEPV
ncbi:MAG TPA: response regulator transcription factor [Bacilli bacterium]|nr:response regulator transcription factor [Bacilli bacterium]